jgi:isocitrate lyase
MSTVGTPKSPEQIQHDWNTNPRWKGIERTYTAEDVVAAAPRCSGTSCTRWTSSTPLAR